MNRTIINKNLKVRHESLYVAKHIGVIIDPIPSHAFFILRNQDMKIKRRITIIATPKKQCCTKETNKKISKSRKGQKNSLETRQKISLSLQKKHPMRGKKLSEEHKRKISESHKGKPSHHKGKHLSEETKKILSQKNLGKKLSEETKKKIGLASKGRRLSEEARRKISKTVKQSWQNTETYKKHQQSICGHKHSEKTKKKMSEIKKGKPAWNKGITWPEETRKKLSLRWKNPQFVEKMRKGLNLHPNKPETIILNLLNKLYPGEWKFTGDFSFMINGKNPDFTNINGQKKLIELFGDYWHRGENPQDRIDVFKPFGYQTLIIWERELKDIKQLKRKIFDFCEG